MSDIGQIQEALTRLFGSEAQRIVFWNDPDREFVDMLPELTLGDVTTLRLDELGALEVKIRVDRTEPQAKFLSRTSRTTGCSTSVYTVAASAPTARASICRSLV